MSLGELRSAQLALKLARQQDEQRCQAAQRWTETFVDRPPAPAAAPTSPPPVSDDVQRRRQG
eukprot:3686125-Pyramimonas_sp.AAC.1